MRDVTIAPAADEFGYGALALALYASDIPDGARPSVDELMRYAHRGLEVLGGTEALRLLHDRLRGLNRRLINGELSDDDYCAALAEHWRAPRLERCLAHDLKRLLPAARVMPQPCEQPGRSRT